MVPCPAAMQQATSAKDFAKILEVLRDFECPAEACQAPLQVDQLGPDTQEALEAALRHAVEKQASTAARTTAVAAELLALQAACHAAVQDADKARSDVDKQVYAASDLVTAANIAAKEHQQAKQARQHVDEQRAALREEKTRADGILNGALRVIREGSWQGEEAKADAVASVLQMLSFLRTEQTLMSAATAALSAEPASRGDFDQLTLEEVTKVISSRAAALAAELAAGDAEERQANAEILGLWAIADVASDKVHEGREALLRAEVAAKEAEVRHRDAQQKVADLEQVMERCHHEHRVDSLRVDATQEALQAWERLVAAREAAELAAAREGDAVMADAVEEQAARPDRAPEGDAIMADTAELGAAPQPTAEVPEAEEASAINMEA